MRIDHFRAPKDIRAKMTDADHLFTVRDFLRRAISRFNQADLVYGHGTTTALDEAAFIVLEGLRLPIDQLEPFLDARLLPDERERLAGLIEARVTTRKPAAYLLNKAYVGGVPFFVDERVIVPRSFIGELLRSEAIVGGDNSLIPDIGSVTSVLDLCTGSGCLALLAAETFPAALVDAVDLSPAALDVARRNVADFAMDDRVTLHEGDLFAPLSGRQYDLIITNPPYVGEAVMSALPPEFLAEPAMALDGGVDGFDIVRRILAEAGDYLHPEGALMCEIGEDRELLEAEFPNLPFLWLDTLESDGEVFFLPAEALGFTPPPRAAAKKARRRSRAAGGGAASGGTSGAPRPPRR
jgi:ribosomal protein L3 glutamine methyltransferase